MPGRSRSASEAQSDSSQEEAQNDALESEDDANALTQYDEDESQAAPDEASSDAQAQAADAVFADLPDTLIAPADGPVVALSPDFRRGYEANDYFLGVTNAIFASGVFSNSWDNGGSDPGFLPGGLSYGGTAYDGPLAGPFLYPYAWAESDPGHINFTPTYLGLDETQTSGGSSIIAVQSPLIENPDNLRGLLPLGIDYLGSLHAFGQLSGLVDPTFAASTTGVGGYSQSPIPTTLTATELFTTGGASRNSASGSVDLLDTIDVAGAAQAYAARETADLKDRTTNGNGTRADNIIVQLAYADDEAGTTVDAAKGAVKSAEALADQRQASPWQSWNERVRFPNEGVMGAPKARQTAADAWLSRMRRMVEQGHDLESIPRLAGVPGHFPSFADPSVWYSDNSRPYSDDWSDLLPSVRARITLRTNVEYFKTRLFEGIYHLMDGMDTTLDGMVVTEADKVYAANKIADAYIRAVDDFLAEHPGARPAQDKRNALLDWLGIQDEFNKPWCDDWAQAIEKALGAVVRDDPKLRRMFSVQNGQWFDSPPPGNDYEHNWAVLIPLRADLPVWGGNDPPPPSVPALFLDPWAMILPFFYSRGEKTHLPLTGLGVNPYTK